MKIFEKKIDEAKILIWDLKESIDVLKNELVEFNEAEFIKIASDKRKREFLGVRLALKALIGKNVHIRYDDAGKPFLSDNCFKISISHSKNWIAVMTHPTRSVGIDIECPTCKIQRIYKRFMSPIEQRELSNGENINQLQLAWSVKETLYKIIGNEAVDFSNQLRIFPFKVKSEGEIMAQHIPSKKLYQLHYTQNPDYTLVYCLE